MVTRTRLAMTYGMVDAALFGVGAVLVLTLAAQEQWKYLLPLVITAAFILAARIAWARCPFSARRAALPRPLTTLRQASSDLSCRSR